MFKIKKLNKISPEGLAVFPLDKYEIGTEITHPDAIILRSYNLHNEELPETLLAIGRAGAGVNNIPIEKCSERGIVVFNTPGANANAVKELTIAGLLLASRDIIGGVNFAKTLKGKGAEVPKLVEENKKRFAGQEIAGKTLGIIGLGKIGVMVANAAIDLGMNVIGYDPFISVQSAWGLSKDVQRAEGIDVLLKKSDYISLHMPLNDETKGLINHEKFKQMKKGAILLNFSRGGIVNNEDLKKAIEEGTIKKYVTDFPDEDLISIDNVIPIPHLGASTYEAEKNCAIMVSNQIKDFLEKGNIKNSVNYPDCKLEESSKYRLVIMNKNIPNMVGQISSLLAKQNINIVEMLNKSKGNYAYNIIDLSNPCSDETVKNIYSIQGVIKVRQINFVD